MKCSKKILNEKYTIQKLQKELLDVVKGNLEELLGLKFDIIEFKFVLNYYTYQRNASNIIQFCEKNKINYILFDYKKFLLFDKNNQQITELKIDNNSIIIDKNKSNIFNDFYNEEEYLEKEENTSNNINNLSNITNTNQNNNSISDDDLINDVLINDISDKKDNNNQINIEEGDNLFNKQIFEFNNDSK